MKSNLIGRWRSAASRLLGRSGISTGAARTVFEVEELEVVVAPGRVADPATLPVPVDIYGPRRSPAWARSTSAKSSGASHLRSTLPACLPVMAPRCTSRHCAA